MIILDGDKINNSEFGIVTVYDGNRKYKLRCFKTIDKYLVVFGFGKGIKTKTDIVSFRQMIRNFESSSHKFDYQWQRDY